LEKWILSEDSRYPEQCLCLRRRSRRRFRIATTDSLHGLPIAPNLLDRNFTVTPLGYLLASPHMLVVAGHADPKYMALHPDRPYPLVALDEGVPHFCPLAKYAIAFPRMSRSMVNRP
jgi:hypothetical protein